jgi:hypothetical protein
MLFSALTRAIAAAEQKQFYDIALVFLRARGYKDLKIVDGPGDGGKDVTCSDVSIRIQLSVADKWQRKITDEAVKSLNEGKSHYIYLTNKAISDSQEANFISTFKHAGQVDVRIFDRIKISTQLSASPLLDEVHQILGFKQHKKAPLTYEATLSTVMLFGDEAKEIRESTVTACLKSLLYERAGLSSSDCQKLVKAQMSVAGTDVLTGQAIDRCRQKGEITGPNTKMELSAAEAARIGAERADFEMAEDGDLKKIMEVTNCSRQQAETILKVALNFVVMKGSDSTIGLAEDALDSAISEVSKSQSCRSALKELLPTLLTVQKVQYGSVVAQVFSTNTFDIYRALGHKQSMTVVLDSNVIMPLLMGLEFGFLSTRFSISAKALLDGQVRHGFSMGIPSSFLNEMASHGKQALSYYQTYQSLPEYARAALEGGSNAFVSHHAALEHRAKDSPDFLQFLRHFGIIEGRSLARMEREIADLVEVRGFTILPTKDIPVEHGVFAELNNSKKHEHSILVTHDAEVVTYINTNKDEGYLLATWDYHMREVVAGTSRILASNPAKLADLLAVTGSAAEDLGASMNFTAALVHMEERETEKLAKLIEQIKSEEQGFRLKEIVENARVQFGQGWQPTNAEMEKFVEMAVRPEMDR